MPKRKLSELSGPARLDTRKLSIKAVRLTTKFEQGVQLLAKGLKTARGFERQKLSRREKTAKTDGNTATLSRLAEEVEALKAIDYQVTAERYLFKQLLKTNRIAETPTFKEFQEAKNVSIEGPKSAAESNVHGRLFKSTPVKNVMPDIMDGIRKLLGVEEAPAGAKKDAPKKEKPGVKRADVCESDEKDIKKQKKVPTEKDEELETHDGENMSISGSEDPDSEDLAQFDARLAPGSDSEDDSGSDENDSDADRQQLGVDDISDSVSRSPSPAFSTADSPPPKKAKGAKASSAPVQSTTFLPSLMMGGYWSGSEEATDDEGAAGPPKRKNRMGQQARRALWEKKYGSQANHVQEEQKKQKWSRDSGWDTRKGATGGTGGRGDRSGRGDRGGRGGFGGGQGRPQNHYDDRSGFGQGHGGKPKAPPKDTGLLHPSWEAKRKLKEQASTATFQGKKVVFD